MNHTHAPLPSGNQERTSALDNAAFGSHSDSVTLALAATGATFLALSCLRPAAS